MNKSFAPTRRRGEQDGAQAFDMDDVATNLVLEHGAMILRDARRYSVCMADAEDAYQRSLVIMLTRAPSSDPDELVPWLRVVVRREAAEIARARRRSAAGSVEDAADRVASPESLPDELAEESFDIGVGIEALGKLKPDQVRCLLAQAAGNTYSQIANATGFSQRKVARCVNEGRRAFLTRVEEIQAGSECARINELLPQIALRDQSALASSAAHLANCSACRISVREYCDAPQNARALFPPTLFAVASCDPTNSLIDGATGSFQALFDRVQTATYSVQRWLEIGGAKKAFVIVATTGTIVGAGVAMESSGGPSAPRATGDKRAGSLASTGPAQLYDSVRSHPPARHRSVRRRHAIRAATRDSKPPVAAPPQPNQKSNATSGDGSSEFLPEQR